MCVGMGHMSMGGRGTCGVEAQLGDQALSSEAVEGFGEAGGGLLQLRRAEGLADAVNAVGRALHRADGREDGHA